MRKRQGRGFKWTKVEEDKLIRIYNITKYTKLIKIFDRSEMAIIEKALKLGLKRKKALNDYNRIWTKEEDNYLKDKYEFGNLNIIPNKLGRTRKAVTERAKVLRITRDKELVRRNQRKNEIDEKYFCELNKDSVYILGLICADGNISKSSNAISISLHKNDCELLENISKKMRSEYKIRFPKNTNMSVFSCESKPMHESLMNLGITPNKSKTLKCPEIPKKFIPDFIRGVLDGDGSVNTKAKRAKIVTASKRFAEGISDLLNKVEVDHKLYNSGYIHKEKKIDFYVINILRRQAVKRLYELMYKDIDLFLIRKKKAFESMDILNINFDNLYSCNKKAIIATNIHTGEIINFASVVDAIRAGYCNKRVYNVLNGKKPHHKNYTWKYV